MNLPIPRPSVIGPFSGEYRFLSNFWPARVNFDGHTYPAIEHAYQAAKTLVESERIPIQFESSPGAAKRMGKRVTMRPDWESVKLSVMEELLRHKFTVEPLRTQLLATYPHELVEINTWNDTFWGVCRGVGENHLGRLLMKIRDEKRGG